MANITKAGPPGLLIKLEDETDFFGSVKPSSPSIPRIKIDHEKGVFLVPDGQGGEDEFETLEDLVAVHLFTGRVNFDGDGGLVCRSNDGIMPAEGGEYEGPCGTCEASKWGPKIGGKSQPPECAETINVVCYFGDRPAAVLQGKVTSLQPIKGFFEDNFKKRRLPPFVSYFSVSLEEKTGPKKKTYYVPVLTLGEGVDAKLQQVCYGLWKEAKEGLMALSDEAPAAEKYTGKQTVSAGAGKVEERDEEEAPRRRTRAAAAEEEEPPRRRQRQAAADEDEPKRVQAEVVPDEEEEPPRRRRQGSFR